MNSKNLLLIFLLAGTSVSVDGMKKKKSSGQQRLNEFNSKSPGKKDLDAYKAKHDDGKLKASAKKLEGHYLSLSRGDDINLDGATTELLKDLQFEYTNQTAELALKLCQIFVKSDMALDVATNVAQRCMFASYDLVRSLSLGLFKELFNKKYDSALKAALITAVQTQKSTDSKVQEDGKKLIHLVRGKVDQKWFEELISQVASEVSQAQDDEKKEPKKTRGWLKKKKKK